MMSNHAESDAASNQLEQRKRWLKNLAAVLSAFIVCYALYWLFSGRFYETTDDAYINGNKVEVIPQVPGKVTEILAEQTDFVVRGQPLIKLDSTDAEVALKNAEAQLALTARQVSQLYKNAEQLEANVLLQQANYTKALQDYQRRQGLVVNKIISREELQHAKLAVDSAKDAVELAKHQFAGAVGLINNSDLYHHPQILQAEANLRNAFLAWKRTTIYASDTGYIAKRNVQIGQQVNPNLTLNPLMIIVPLNQVWVEANFKESQLKYFRIGQPVELISDLYGSSVKFKGTIVGLSPGTGSTFDLLPPQNATGNWIKIVQRVPVRIALDPQQLAKYPLEIGLSMIATVNTHSRKGAILQKYPKPKVLLQTKDYSADLKEADAIINDILQKNASNLSYSSTENENATH